MKKGLSNLYSIIIILTVLGAITTVFFGFYSNSQEENEPPRVSFNYSPSTPKISDTIRFSDNTTDPDGKILSCKWKFGDGDSSSVNEPNHTYDIPGTYKVTLTATDDDGENNTLTKTIEITHTRHFSTSNQDINITFLDQLDPYENLSHLLYYWDNIAKFVTPENPVVKNLAEKLENIYLTTQSVVENEYLANFVLEFVQKEIFYPDLETENLLRWSYAPEIIYSRKGACSGASILYASLMEALGFDACLIRFPNENHMMAGIKSLDGSDSPSLASYGTTKGREKNGVIYWPAEVTHYKFNLGEQSKGLTSDNYQIYPIGPPPIASASADKTQGKPPLEINFEGHGTDADGKIISRHWNFDDGATSDNQNQTHTFQEEGKYEVEFTVTDDDGETDAEYITINAIDLSNGNWVETANYIGSSDENTNIFQIQGNKFKVTYSAGGNPENGYLLFSIHPEGKPENHLAYDYIDLDEHSGREVDELTYVFEGPGNYYCEVWTWNLDSWSIEIHDWQ